MNPTTDSFIRKRVNREHALCRFCGLPVTAHSGVEWETPGPTERDMGEPFCIAVAHLACDIHGVAMVEGISDRTGTFKGIRNREGRCEDAPCCGCCYP